MGLIFKYFENCVKYLLIVFLFKTNISQAQESILVLSNKCTKVSSPFTKVNGIDRRFPEKDLGFVLTGGLNNNSKVSFKENFIDSLCSFFVNKDKSLATENELSIILYEFRLSEKAEEMKNTVSFKLSMRVFKKIEGSRFEEIFSIDTLYRMSSSTDLTKKLLKSVNEHLCEVAVELNKVENLRAENKPSYTFSELQILDSLEKIKTPIYITDKYKAGIYYSFNQFKNHTPDTTTVYIDSTNSDKIRVKIWSEEKEKNVELDSKSVYAVCDGSSLFKATKMGFYEMKREGYDFYFFGQTAPKNLTNGNNAIPIIGPAAGGLVLGVGFSVFIPYNQKPVLDNFKIDYRTGNPIQVDKDE